MKINNPYNKKFIKDNFVKKLWSNQKKKNKKKQKKKKHEKNMRMISILLLLKKKKHWLTKLKKRKRWRVHKRMLSLKNCFQKKREEEKNKQNQIL